MSAKQGERAYPQVSAPGSQMGDDLLRGCRPVRRAQSLGRRLGGELVLLRTGALLATSCLETTGPHA